jgi:hypothetical protein
MEPWLAALIIVGAAALGAVGMLVARWRAPAGTLFEDPIPAAAVYTVAGTAYMVIVAFVFFIAFESYGGAKDDAEEEATATLAMFHAAGPFDPAARAEPQEQLTCYAREVISSGWPAMREAEGVRKWTRGSRPWRRPQRRSRSAMPNRLPPSNTGSR